MLDSNGYAPSIMPLEEGRCFHCQNFKLDVARHEIFGGALRDKSKRYGLWITVCPECHAKIHASGDLQRHYHKEGQAAAMKRYGWTVEAFMEKFYKSYL